MQLHRPKDIDSLNADFFRNEFSGDTVKEENVSPEPETNLIQAEIDSVIVENESDMEEIADEVKANVRIVSVSNAAQALSIALAEDPFVRKKAGEAISLAEDDASCGISRKSAR